MGSVELTPILAIAVFLLFWILLVKQLYKWQNSLSKTQAQSTVSQASTLTISAPVLKWESSTAVNFIASLFTLPEPVRLQIIASRQGIVWQIVVSHNYEDIVKRSLLALYPHADITTVKPVEPNEQTDTEYEYSCAECGAFVSQEDAVCPVCGVVFVDENAEDKDLLNNVENEQSDTVWGYYCGDCGATVSPDDAVCPSCGEVLEDEEEIEQQPVYRAPQANKLVLVPLKETEKDDWHPCKECGAAITQEDGFCPTCGLIFNVSSGFAMLGGSSEYFAPIVYAKDTDIDPLTGIVGAMAHLADNETIIYQIELTPSERNYGKEGYKKIRKSTLPYVLSVLAGNRVFYVSRRAFDKFDAHHQRVFEEKLQSSMIPASVKLFVHSYDGERRVSLMNGLIAATSMFDRDDGNGLTNNTKAHPLRLSPQEVAALWHLPTEDMQTLGIIRTSGARAPLPVELMQTTSGLLLGTNTYQEQTHPVYLAHEDRITHMNIIGRTRVGKTTLMHNLIDQDIRNGQGVAVIDPHGDLIQNILESSIPPKREKDVVLFDLADTEHPVPLNLLYTPVGVDRHAAVGLTMGVMKKLFADQWSATRMEDALYSALAVLVDINGATIRHVPRLFLDERFRTAILAQAHDEVALEYWREEFEMMSERYQLEVARPIMNRIRAFYRNPAIRQIIDQPESIDVRSLMDGRKIFLASLAGETSQAESPVIGALLISKIQMAAMSRANVPVERRQNFYLYIDEVQNFVTTSLPVMFSEAAKYALSLTIANQFLRQLTGNTLDAVLGNTGTTIMFACGSQDAKDLGAYIKPIFDSETLLNLDRFQAVVKMQKSGKTLPAFNLQAPKPLNKRENATETAQRIRTQALAAYTRKPVEETEGSQESSVSELLAKPSDTDEKDIPALDL